MSLSNAVVITFVNKNSAIACEPLAQLARSLVLQNTLHFLDLR